MEKYKFAEQVFDTVNGYLVEDACVREVENLFAPGKDCAMLYHEMILARARLAERTGLDEDDPDIEGIISPLLKITKAIGLKMFAYGEQLSGK